MIELSRTWCALFLGWLGAAALVHVVALQSIDLRALRLYELALVPLLQTAALLWIRRSRLSLRAWWGAWTRSAGRLRQRLEGLSRQRLVLAGAALTVVALAALRWRPAALLVGLLLVLSGAIALRSDDRWKRRLARGALVSGLGIALLPLVLRSALGSRPLEATLVTLLLSILGLLAVGAVLVLVCSVETLLPAGLDELVWTLPALAQMAWLASTLDTLPGATGSIWPQLQGFCLLMISVVGLLVLVPDHEVHAPEAALRPAAADPPSHRPIVHAVVPLTVVAAGCLALERVLGWTLLSVSLIAVSLFAAVLQTVVLELVQPRPRHSHRALAVALPAAAALALVLLWVLQSPWQEPVGPWLVRGVAALTALLGAAQLVRAKPDRPLESGRMRTAAGWTLALLLTAAVLALSPIWSALAAASTATAARGRQGFATALSDLLLAAAWIVLGAALLATRVSELAAPAVVTLALVAAISGALAPSPAQLVSSEPIRSL